MKVENARVAAIAARALVQATELGHDIEPWEKNRERFGIVWRTKCARCGKLLDASENPVFGLPEIMGLCFTEPCDKLLTN